MSNQKPDSAQHSCPSCGQPLKKVAGSDAQLCRACVMRNVMGASSAPARPAHAAVDDYDIIREIGRGGGGTVYLAMDKKMRRRVAIKLLNTMRGHDEVSEQRFRAETEATAALDHPNIIPIYANGEMDGRPFFTMKHVAGGSLASRGSEFTHPPAAVALLEKIARAVHHAHERGILHRDLKPSNILLDKSGEPFVSDFGIAKREGDELHLTMTGTVVGTPNYMSPEQARGDNSQLTTGTDVFSLGAMFYELLNGRQAFEGNSSHSVISNVIDSDVTFTRNESTKLQRDLTSICLKCLEKSPAGRYNSALALAEDLARWRRGEPVEARHITSSERAWRWMRRRPVLVSAIGIAVASLLGGTFVSVREAQHAEAAHAIAEANAYFAEVGSALSARERSDFGEALRHLRNCPAEMRDRFEWRLVNALSTGDHAWSTRFGIGNPIGLTFNPADSQLMLLTKDRQIHHVDRWSGEVLDVSHLPETGSTGDYLQLREFRCAPDGRHYFFIDGEVLYVVKQASGAVIHRTAALPPDPSAVWLSADRLLYARGTAPEGFTLPPETAWTYELSSDRTMPLHDKGWTSPITVSPDGKKVALVRMATKVVVFPSDSNFHGDPEFRLRSNPPYKQLAFSGDMKGLAVHSGGNDSLLEVFDLATEERVFEDYWPAPSQISLTSGVHDVITTDQESWFVRCRALGVKKRLTVLQDPVRVGTPRRHQADGPIAPPPRSFINNLTGSRKQFIIAHAAPLVAFQMLPGEGDFYTASRDGSLRYWKSNIPAAYPPRLDSHRATARSHQPVASNNGEHVAMRSSHGPPGRWTREAAGIFVSLDMGQALAVVDDGRTFTRSAEGEKLTCRESTTDSNSLIESWSIPLAARHDSTFVHSNVTPDESLIASLFSDHVLIIDVKNRSAREIETPQDKSDETSNRSIAISGDGAWVAITGFDDYVTHLCELRKTDAEFIAIRTDASRSSRASTCGFSRSGDRLYVGSLDGWVRVFEPRTRSELSAESWRAHSHSISAIAISQGDDIIATAGGSSVTLWSAQLETGKPRRFRIQLNTGPGARNWLQFCAGDTLLLHSAPDRPIEVLRAPAKRGLKRIPRKSVAPTTPTG